MTGFEIIFGDIAFILGDIVTEFLVRWFLLKENALDLVNYIFGKGP